MTAMRLPGFASARSSDGGPAGGAARRRIPGTANQSVNTEVERRMELKTDRMIAEKDGAIGWMIYNNPARRNAVSLAMREAAAQIYEA